ncbi:AdeC/AdeK/OprM family multidrug efflux complex outer membrane factor [Paludibacterium paludis]|uniref:Multidrug transporter n=1 Tax=Paludibacterium paludis TaxID=1225769 RepID=A0A918P5V5_9NEIS|nr:AdeC/AdeK/OprM family multidrug efflux complex outer membrane factor [Paludibacterium paludis]GGY23117.1 multidrug transporter [Paludibacterium paludis]
MLKRPSLLGASVAAALLAGCTMAPDYQRPALPVAGAFPAGDAYAPATDTGAAASELPWRDFFRDPALKTLIGMALENNRDLRVAALNIEAARAQYQIAGAPLFPGINASGGQSAQGTADAYRAAGQPRVSRSYTGGVGFSAYEIDLFGRLRSLKESALESYFGKEETRKSTQISLVAEVANAWYALLADRDRLAFVRDTLKTRLDSQALIQRRFELGSSSALDLAQADSLVQSARSDMASLTSQVARDENALTLLVGAAVPADLLGKGSLKDQADLPDLPAGLPSQVLLNRPDVLLAEHQLKAANANIGAARANFFPRITLTGSVGSASPTLSGLFDSGSGTWSFGPSISLPIFDGGVNLATLRTSKVQRDIAVAQYEKTVQTAFREVADALAVRGTIEEQWSAQQKLAEAARLSYGLSNARYKAGVDSYLTLLDAQRSLYSAEQSLIVTRQARLASRVTLYKVLGGGWQPEPGAVKGS